MHSRNSSEFPGLSHHEAEVIVGVDACRHILVVVTEFIEGDDAVCILGIPHAHVLTVGFLGRLLAVDNVGVLADIVDASNIVKFHQAILVDVELVVCLTNVANAACAELTTERPKELIEVDGSGVVAVEVADEDASLLLTEMNIEVLEAPHELIDVKLPVSIIVQDAEHSTNAANGHGAAPLQRLLDVIHHLLSIVARRSLNRLSTSLILRQDNLPEVLGVDLLVLALTNFLSVVLTSEHLGLVLG